MGHISLEGDTIAVSDWNFTDKAAADVLRSSNCDEWPSLFAHLVRIGALAVRDAADIGKIDYVRVELSRFLAELRSLIDRGIRQELGNIFDVDHGVFPTTAHEFLGPEGALAKMFDDRRVDSIPFKLKAILEENLTGPNSAFVRALDPNHPDTPIGLLRTQLARAVDDAKMSIITKLATAEAVEEIAERTPLKGPRFEDKLLSALGDIANTFGDSVEDVRAANKDGDFLVTIDPKYSRSATLRIAFEAKDRSVSLPQTQRELENAKRQWAAAAAVMVFGMPEECPQDSAFRHTAQGYLCVYDKDALDTTALQVAYQLARVDVLRGIEGDRVASARLDEAGTLLDHAVAKLREISSMKSTLTGVTKTISEVYLGLEKLQHEVVEDIAEAHRCIVRITGASAV